MPKICRVPQEELLHWQREGWLEGVDLRDDMEQVLSQLSVVALPTYFPGGIPKVLLEAAAAGRSIVTTSAPGCYEIVRDGENGLLVPPTNPGALADTLATLLRDRSLRQKREARGRELLVRGSIRSRLWPRLSRYTARCCLIGGSRAIHETWPATPENDWQAVERRSAQWVRLQRYVNEEDTP
jgi:glycosyltransferase involved in cell wall biosynthesis